MEVKKEVSEEFQEFIVSLSHNVANHKVMVVGSIVELPLQYIIQKLVNFQIPRLHIFNDVCAIPSGFSVPKLFRGKVFITETSETNPGFARLRFTGITTRSWKTGNYLRRSDSKVLRSEKFRKSGKLGKGQNFSDPIDAFEKIGALEETLINATKDVEEAIASPYWPPEASEWVTRRREGGWPSKELVDKVLEGGCHLVTEGDPSIPGDETIFRFSFSLAETLLVHRWNPVQKFIYHLLRLIKDDVVKQFQTQGQRTVLNGYHFKTLMMWACEKKPAEFWHKENLKSSVDELLCQMIECLVERNCPNYFLPRNNLLGHVSDDLDMNAEIMPLLVYKEQGASRLGTAVPMADPDRKCHLLISDKLISIGQLINRSTIKDVERVQTTALQDRPLRKEERVDPAEFLDLYHGLLSHLRLASRAQFPVRHHEVSDRDKAAGDEFDEKEAEEYLQKAVRKENQGFSSRAVWIGRTLFDMFDDILYHGEVIGDSSKTSEQLLKDDVQGNKEDPGQEDNIGSRSVVKLTPEMETSSQADSASSSVAQEEKVSKKVEATSDFQMIADLFSSVFFPFLDKMLCKASYCVSTAYQANFYYSYRHDYTQALLLCEETEGAYYNPSKRFGFYNCETFCSVVLSAKWMPIFDPHIQTVCGFVELAKAVRRTRNGGPLPVGLQPSLAMEQYISPVDLCSYIKMQCHRQLEPFGIWSGLVEYDYSTYHRWSTRSSLITLTALRISGNNLWQGSETATGSFYS